MIDINTLKAIDIKQLIEKETDLKFTRNGKTLEKCPFCGSGSGENKSPGFNIDVSKNIFKCFVCCKKGNPIEFIKYFKNYDNKSAIFYLSENYSDLPKSKKNKAPNTAVSIKKTISAIKNNPKDKANEYLKSRGIAIGKFNDTPWHYDSYFDAIIFIDTENNLINRRGIGNNKLKGNAKGSELKNAIYAGNYQENIDTLFICESPIDSLSLDSFSSVSIFSTSNKFTDKEKIKKYVSGKTVILAFDGDKAGHECTEYYKKFLIDSNLDILSLKSLVLTEGKDINELLQESSLNEYANNQANYTILWEPEPDITLTPIEANSENIEQSLSNFGYYKKNGSYFIKTSYGKTLKDEKVSNFLMEILYHFVDGTNNTRRLIKIQRYTGELKTIEVLSSETKKDTFETILKSHSCTFTGAPYVLNNIFSELMDHEIKAIKIDSQGYISEYDIYAFSDSIINSKNKLLRINSIGIIQDAGNMFYLPPFAQTNLNNPDFEQFRRFRFKQGELNFKEWSANIYQAYGINGGIGLCFFINSIFRDIVFSDLNFFPYLFLFGQAGVGKSTFIDFFLRPFGDKETGDSLKTSTTKAISRKVSQKKNAIVFLKEYDSTLSRDIIAFFKNAYDGATYAIAEQTTDNKTKSFIIQSSVFVDGNVLPTSESALYDRMIVLNFEKDLFSESETKAYKTLIDQSEKGLGQIIREIHSYRTIFKEEFRKVYRETYDELKFENPEHNNVRISNLPERTLKHIAFLLTPYRILYKKLSFPFTWDELVIKIIEDALQKVDLLSDLKDVSIFWDAISWDRKKDFNEVKQGIHYILSDVEKIIYIKLKEIFPVYMNYCKTNNIQYVDISTLISLLTSQNKDFIKNTQKGNKSTYNKKEFGRCFRFRYDMSDNERIIIINDKEVYL